MARDYAKSRPSSSGRGAAARRSGGSGKSGGSGGGRPGLVAGLLIGLSLGLCAAGWVWISRPAKNALPGVAAATSPAASAAASAAQAESNKPIQLPPKQPSKYTFYELLPSYEVVIPREDAAASAKTGKPTTPDIAEPGQYLIQIGAYKTRDEAERSRASLALLGVESKIEQVTIDQTETWFRVRIGPQASLAKAQEIMQRLDDNGIKGMLVKVKAG
jgi:cell division protein FtsN